MGRTRRLLGRLFGRRAHGTGRTARIAQGLDRDLDQWSQRAGAANDAWMHEQRAASQARTQQWWGRATAESSARMQQAHGEMAQRLQHQLFEDRLGVGNSVGNRQALFSHDALRAHWQAAAQEAQRIVGTDPSQLPGNGLRQIPGFEARHVAGLEPGGAVTPPDADAPTLPLRRPTTYGQLGRPGPTADRPRES